MHTQDTHASATLRTVDALITTLGKMRDDGLSAAERLDRILDSAKEIIPEFELADAFSFEARSTSARIEKLKEAQDGINQLKGLWSEGPFPDREREAGVALMHHLERILVDRRRVEEKTEMELLASLWKTDPDLSALYPWLTTWAGPVQKTERRPTPSPEDERWSTPSEEKLLRDVHDLAVSAMNENLSRIELEPKLKEPLEDLKPETQTAPQPQLEASSLEASSLEASSLEEPKLEKETAPPSQLEKPLEELKLEEPSFHLVVQAWTEALDDHTATHWKYDGTERQNDETTLRWSRPGEEGASAVLVMRHQTANILVLLRVLVPRQNMLERATTTVDFVGIGALHANPDAFVKTLRPG